MDFDDEMSGLQIEDLGEYFLQTDIGDSWKGFSLGYVEEEKSSGQQLPSQQQQSNYQHTNNNNSGNNAAASQAMRFGSSLMSSSMAVSSTSSAPIAIPSAAQNQSQQQQQQFTSPPMSSFSEMLKHGNGFSLGSPRQDFSFSPAMFASAANLLKADTDSKINDDPMDLSNFSLDALKKIPSMPQPTAPMQTPKAAGPAVNLAIKPSPAKSPSPAVCQNILETQEKPAPSKVGESSSMFGATAKRTFDEVESCSMDSCSTIGQPEDDRGYRKKSREKMRRQEVNVKFDELVDLLGLSNRVRKSAILQEAVAAIKSLKRERDEMRRDRDRLQHEVSKLATCLQYSHLGSVAAASAMSMTQVPHHLSHMNPSTQLSQMNSSNSNPMSGVPHALQVQGAACFPIGSGFGNLPSGSSASTLGNTATSSTSTTSIAIAPKMVKPSPASPFTANTAKK